KLFNNDKDDKTFTFQVGASKGQTAEVKIGKMDAVALGVDDTLTPATEDTTDPKNPKAVPAKGVDLSTADNARDSIAHIKAAIETVSGQRADLGAAQNG
ncbi:flagellin, partial [Latilactobacillus curvatus]|nr:flagellin [Latilactobacillus curvatus]